MLFGNRWADQMSDELYLPRNQWGLLKETLNKVLWLSDELDTTISRQSQFTSKQPRRVSNDDERPLPFHEKASDRAHELNGLLNEWILKVCTERTVDWPGYLRTPQAARWVHTHLTYLALTEGSDEFLGDLRATAKQCERIVDRPAGTVYAGPCPGNDTWCTDLYVRPGSPTVTCPHCGNTWDVHERRDYMFDEARSTLGTAAELASILPWFMDSPIDRKRINYLARRKMIVGRPFPDGTERFQLGEVVDAHNQLVAHRNSA